MSVAGVNVISEDAGELKKFNQHIGALVASLGGFAFGVSLGWNSSTNEVLRNILNASLTEIGLIGGILNAGAMLGALLVIIALKFLGRIALMFLTMPLLVVGWAFICFADQRVSLLIVGRSICGICGGAFCVLTPIHIGEIADKKIRGRLLLLFQLLINCGIMYAFAVAHALEERDTVWRYSLICALSCLVIIPIKFLPESPFHYLRKNDEIKARTSLRWYRGRTYDLDGEMNELKRLVALSQSEKITTNTLRNPRVLRSLFACLLVMLAQQLSGINTMIFYALTLFNTAGSGELTGSEQTLVIAAAQIVSCILATLLIDVLGRRLLLTVSSMLMGLFLVLLGWFFDVRDADPEYDDFYSWMPPTWTCLFFFAFNIGVGPIFWAILADIFPTEIKIPAAAIAVAFNWLISLIATMTFGDMLVALGVSRLMWLFAGFCWITAILCAIVVRDSTGKSLLEVQEGFKVDSGSNES